MYKNFRRLLVIYKGARGPFIFLQALLAVSVLLNLAIVALNGTLVNDGVQQSNLQVVIATAVWMIGLTLVKHAVLYGVLLLFQAPFMIVMAVAMATT